MLILVKLVILVILVELVILDELVNLVILMNLEKVEGVDTRYTVSDMSPKAYITYSYTLILKRHIAVKSSGWVVVGQKG